MAGRSYSCTFCLHRSIRAATALLLLRRRTLRLANSKHEDQILDSVVLDGLGLPSCGAVSSPRLSREESTQRIASVEGIDMSRLVTELAESEDGIASRLLVGGVGNKPLLNQIMFESGEVL